MFRRLLGAIFFGAASSVALASPLYVSYDDFHYSGTVTRYGSLADAQAGTNATSSTTITTASNGSRNTLENARDGLIYVVSDSPGYDTSNLVQVATAWYFTTVPANGNGWGNPNNTNNGFVQYYDTSTGPAVSGGWSNGYTRFTLSISGGDGDTTNDARLWAAPSAGGPSGDTSGAFRDFDLTLTTDFGTAATLNSTTGWYESSAAPSSTAGGAHGIFENDSTTDPSLNGFYVFDFTFAPGSWAAANVATWSDGQYQYPPEAFFAAPSSVPAPATLMLLGLGLICSTLISRSRSR